MLFAVSHSCLSIRVLRWIRDEQSKYSNPEGDIMIEHVLLDLTGMNT